MRVKQWQADLNRQGRGENGRRKKTRSRGTGRIPRKNSKKFIKTGLLLFFLLLLIWKYVKIEWVSYIYMCITALKSELIMQ